MEQNKITKISKSAESFRKCFFVRLFCFVFIEHFEQLTVEQSHENVKYYVKNLSNSIFCLCPYGITATSRRMYESIAYGCIRCFILLDFKFVLSKKVSIFFAKYKRNQKFHFFVFKKKNVSQREKFLH